MPVTTQHCPTPSHSIQGADIEALDTYGMTPLHRMASNNHASGAQALLDAGADPENRGMAGATPLQVAYSSAAQSVIEVLKDQKRKAVHISRIIVSGSGEPSVNGDYEAADSSEVPVGFDATCQQQGWDTDALWKQLNGGAAWYKQRNGCGAKRDSNLRGSMSFACMPQYCLVLLTSFQSHSTAYIYWNMSDRHWWIDDPSGAGVFKAPAPSHAPPQLGWRKLGAQEPPELVATMRGE